MWTLALIFLLFAVTPSLAEQHFSMQYERDCNFFNPASKYVPDTPLRPAQAFASDHPVSAAGKC